MRIRARILVRKVVRKNRPIQCNSGVIACVEQYAQGAQMNWSLFLLNQLTEDAVAVQEALHSFTYSRVDGVR